MDKFGFWGAPATPLLEGGVPLPDPTTAIVEITTDLGFPPMVELRDLLNQRCPADIIHEPQSIPLVEPPATDHAVACPATVFFLAPGRSQSTTGEV